MSGLNGLPLADDIIDRILMFSPSFSSLLATILTAKSFYEVFNTHPRSILRAVAFNVVGPALPQALRLIRYRTSDPRSMDLDVEEGQLQEPYETDEKAPITARETHKLVKNAKIVGRLEELWSIRYIDRRCSSSKLTPTESWRFHRAMYRIMHYNLAFSAHDYVEAYTDDEEAFSPAELEQERVERIQFLSEFSTDEILQIRSITIFLMEILELVESFDLPDFGDIGGSCMKDIAFCLGPELILECYLSKSLDPVDDFEIFMDDFSTDSMFTGYLSYPISKVLEMRKAKPPPEDFSHWYYISTEVDSKNDECDRCHESDGFGICCRSNLKERSHGFEFFNVYHAQLLLKSRLKSNPEEKRYLVNKVSEMEVQCRQQSPGTHWCSVVVDSIFDDNLLHPTFASWTKDDALCLKCLQQFLDEHFWRWVLECKKKAGDQIGEDCWYGYNCRTQTHRQEHARRLNHLCEPTRGDR